MYMFLQRKTRFPPHKNTGRGGYPEVSLKKTFFFTTKSQSNKKLIISGDPVFLWNLSGQETSRAATPQREFLLLPNWNSIYVMIKPNVSLCIYIYTYVHVPCASSRCHKARNVPINPLQTCRLACIEYGTLKTPNPFRKEYCGLPCDFDGI